MSLTEASVSIKETTNQYENNNKPTSSNTKIRAKKSKRKNNYIKLNQIKSNPRKIRQVAKDDSLTKHKVNGREKKT